MKKDRKVTNSNSIFTLKNIIIVICLIIGYFILTFLAEGDFLSRQSKSLIVPMGINIILAVSLSLTVGFLGELSLGHAGFMAIGGYTGALITLHMDLPKGLEFTLALIAGGIMAAIFGFLIGLPVLRLKGDYLAIVTLAFGEIIRSVLTSLKITGGAQGLTKIPRYSNYTWVYIVMILTVVLISNFVKSRHGRAIISVRENYIAAESIGIKVSKYKVMAFVIAAFFAGVAGVFYGHNLSILKPGDFDYNKSIEILVIVVLGGMGNIKGSIIAAIALTFLPEMLRSVDEFRTLLYAVVLIAMMLFRSSGFRTKLEESGKLPKFMKPNMKRAK